MLLGLYRIGAERLQHLHPVGERSAKRAHRHQARRHRTARSCENGLAPIVDKKRAAGALHPLLDRLSVLR